MMRRFLAFIFLAAMTLWFGAGPRAHADSLAKLENCLAVIDVVDAKLTKPNWRYSSADVKKTRSGLSKYRDFLQDDLLTRVYRHSSQGDAQALNALQAQTDARVSRLIAANKKVFPGTKIHIAHPVELYGCASFADDNTSVSLPFIKAVAILERLSQT